MKLLFITARYFPEQFSIVNICEQFVKLGHDVTVLTGKPNYGYFKIIDGYETIKEEIIHGVKVYRVNEKARKKGLMGLINNYLSIFIEYNRFLKKHHEDYDIVVSHVMSPIFTMRGIKKFTKKHKIPHVHYGLDLWPESLIATSYSKRKSIIFQLTKIYSRLLYSSCDYITFASPSVEEYFSKYLKIKNIPFKQIYQPTMSVTPKINDVRNHEYCENGKVKILYCGSVARFHRLDLLLNAVKNNLTLFPNKYTIDIVGSGSELDKLIQLSKNLGLEQVVNFHGRVSVEKTREFYLNTDILYVPLYNNSATSKMIPQKLIEYLMYNRPILGMIQGDGKNLLIEASALNVISGQNEKDLSKALNGLIRENSFFAKCGNENRDYYDSNPRFSIETICSELIEICNEVISIY